MTNFEFNATCDVTDLTKCDIGSVFMDPCNCERYYQCTNRFSMATFTCNTGTLWDYTLGNCRHKQIVEIHQNCSTTNAWTRCNTTASRLQDLESLCTGSTPNTSVITAGPPKEDTIIDSSINAGMVAGLIIAGAVITLAIIALYVLYTRRKKAKAQEFKRRTTIENREYFENGHIDDPYAIIDERMVPPVYSNNNINQTGSTNGTISTTTTTLPGDETITEYDNSAFRDDDYTATLEREPVTPYDTLGTSTRSYEKPKNNSNNDAIGASSGEASVAGSSGGNVSDENDSGVAVGGVSNEAGVDTDGKQAAKTATRVNDDMEAPDYYKLDPES